MAGGQPIFEARGMHKDFGAVTALRDVNLTLHRGEVLSVVGDDGAGKSTLMETLFGLYPPGRGQRFRPTRQGPAVAPSLS